MTTPTPPNRLRSGLAPSSEIRSPLSDGSLLVIALVVCFPSQGDFGGLPFPLPPSQPHSRLRVIEIIPHLCQDFHSARWFCHCGALVRYVCPLSFHYERHTSPLGTSISLASRRVSSQRDVYGHTPPYNYSFHLHFLPLPPSSYQQ